jgi:inward rectifier potassium channel
VAAAFYLGANMVFAGLYLLQKGAISTARPGSFADTFFFSIQTMATIGYGVMAPQTFYANLLVTIETLFGVLLLALVTGLAFARFSRPRARVLFSRHAVITPFNGVPTLMLRMANERRNEILQAEVSCALLRTEWTQEGDVIRRFYDLQLSRYRSPVFALTFSVMHPIDESSPLYGATPEILAEMEAELVVTFTGIDETASQSVHARTSYLDTEILFDRRFKDIFGITADGRRAIDFRHFHETEPIDA